MICFSCISLCGAMACSASCCLAWQVCLCYCTLQTSLESLNQLCPCCLQEHFADEFNAVAAANAGKPVLMTGVCFQAACILACSHSHSHLLLTSSTPLLFAPCRHPLLFPFVLPSVDVYHTLWCFAVCFKHCFHTTCLVSLCKHDTSFLC